MPTGMHVRRFASSTLRCCFHLPVRAKHALAAAPAAAPIFSPPNVFALGAANGTNCPGIIFPMTSAAACQGAAAVAGNPYGGSERASYVPGGCYWLTASGTFYFNEHPTGGGNDLAQPVCTGAPDSHEYPMATTVVSLRLCVCVRVQACAVEGRACAAHVNAYADTARLSPCPWGRARGANGQEGGGGGGRGL
jgi:hypothetical protein